MGKNNARTSASKEAINQQKRLNNGRGSGHHGHYTPFLQIERAGFQSRGRSHYVFDERQQRNYHLLSDLELLTFLRVWSSGAHDIREQYPLHLTEFEPEFEKKRGYQEAGTLSIAKKMGIKHPMIDRDTPRILTTDLVANFTNGLTYAIHVKYQSEFESSSTRKQELRKIEKRYWTTRGAHFIVMTEKPFTYLLADQMMWAIDGMNWKGTKEAKDRFLLELDSTSQFARMSDRLHELVYSLDAKYDEIVRLFKHVILTNEWRIHDLSQELDLSIRWTGKRTKTSKPNIRQLLIGPKK